MAKQRKKRMPDPAVMARGIIGHISGESSPGPESDKNPAAVALGRLGGLKGGPARAKKLSKKKLSEIGKKAAAKRWGKSK